MSFGRGRLSRSSETGAVSSSSMISLQRSMHSSQMYTPGPAINFFTCFWLFPQNEHFSRSPPSPNFATRTSSPDFPASAGALGHRHRRELTIRDDLVDEAVRL